MVLAITLLVLRTAKFGDPGGVWWSNSELKAVFAICIHSSRVFRKVSQVDFNRAPILISVCGKKSIGRNGLTTEDQFGATNVCKAHSCYSCDFWLTWIKIQCVRCSENWLCPLAVLPFLSASQYKKLCMIVFWNQCLLVTYLTGVRSVWNTKPGCIHHWHFRKHHRQET